MFLVYRDQVYQYDPQLSSRQANAEIGVVQWLREQADPVTVKLRESLFAALVASGPDQAMALQRPCFLGSVECIDMIECRKYINTLDTQHNITNTHSQPAAKLDTAFQNEDIQSTILLLNSQFWN